MNGQSQGRSTPFSGKKLFALTAVALMVVSCLAAFAVVDEVKAVHGTEEFNAPIVIDCSKDHWDFTDFSAKPTGVTLDGDNHVLTLEGVDVTLNPYETEQGEKFSCAIQFLSSQMNDNPPAEIVLKGYNYITMNGDYSRGIDYTGGGGITITGTNMFEDALAIKCVGTSYGESYGIQALGLNITKATVNLGFVHIGETVYGIYSENTVLTNSKLNVDLCNCDYGYGIYTNNLTIKDESIVSVSPEEKILEDYVGIRVSEKMTITDSTVAVNTNSSGTEDESRGIVTTEGEYQNPVITNSIISSCGRTSAVCAESIEPETDTSTYVGWDASKFTGSVVIGSKTKSITEGEVITGVIGTDYKIVEIKPDVASTHKVTFNLNGGKGDFPVIEKPIDQTITIPSNTPTKEGFTFHCWHGSDGVDYHPGDVIPANTADLILTAHWESGPGPAPAEDSPDYTAIYVVIALFAILLVIGVVFGRNKDKE